MANISTMYHTIKLYNHNKPVNMWDNKRGNRTGRGACGPGAGVSGFEIIVGTLQSPGIQVVREISCILALRSYKNKAKGNACNRLAPRYLGPHPPDRRIRGRRQGGEPTNPSANFSDTICPVSTPQKFTGAKIGVSTLAA